MLTETFTSKRFFKTPTKNIIRYVRVNPQGVWFWCEVDARERRFDLRQGRCAENDVPAHVADAAKALMGVWPSYTVWNSKERAE